MADDRKRTRKYKAMFKKHGKEIMKDAKAAARDPFDWMPGLKVFVDHLYFMREYYDLGVNVMACEVDGYPPRKQILDDVLKAFEDWQGCDDKYTKVIYKSDPGASDEIIKLINEGYTVVDNSDNGILKGVVLLHKHADYKVNTQEFVKEYEECRKRFFSLLADYIELLWD